MTAGPDGRRRLAERYRIDGLLGRGGMSEVHYGHDERLDRPVAIKLAPGSLPELRMRHTLALDCAYQAGQAYAEAAKPDKALPQLRYRVCPLVRRPSGRW